MLRGALFLALAGRALGATVPETVETAATAAVKETVLAKRRELQESGALAHPHPQARQLQADGQVQVEYWIFDTQCTEGAAKLLDGVFPQDTCLDDQDGTSIYISCNGCTVTSSEYESSSTCAGTAITGSYPSGTCFGLGFASIRITCPNCGSDPCFAKESTHAVLKSGEHVLMSSLRAGDLVKDGPNSHTRVVVNQHAGVDKAASLINIEHTNGSLALTPDHALFFDGKLGAARDVKVGSKLGDAEVLRLGLATGAVVNPITVSGKILAVDKGEPVLAAAHPEWIAQYLLDSYVPLPFSLSNLISYLFPATTQDFYDEHLEGFFQGAAPNLKKWQKNIPAAAIAPTFVACDLAVAAGFVAYCLATPKAAITLAAVFAAKKLARKA